MGAALRGWGMCGLCERSGPGFAPFADPTGEPFQPLVAVFIDPWESGQTTLLVPQPGAPALVTGGAADEALVAGFLTRVAFAAGQVEPGVPAAPSEPETNTILRAASPFADETLTVLDSARVRIETNGGTDTIRLGSGTPGPVITAVVIGGAGRQFVQGFNARVTGYFLTGDDFDVISGTFGAGSQITAFLGAGNDQAALNSGQNYIDGGIGDDFLRGGDGADILIGGDGNDQIYGQFSTIPAGPVPGGNDQLFGGAGNDLILGAGGDDELVGGDGDDRLVGLWGNDRLWGGNGNDSLDGGDGNDVLFGGAGEDVLNSGAGDDILIGSVGLHSLNGGAGNDILLAGPGNRSLDGSEGDDVLIDQADVPAFLRGSSGNDIFIVRSPGTTILETANQGFDTVYTDVNGWVPPANIERVVYMNGAVQPTEAVLALHGTRLRPLPETTTIFRYAFVEAPFSTSRTTTTMFDGSNRTGGQPLQMVPLDANFRLAFRQAADEYERVANIRFVEVTNPAEADFAVGAHNMFVAGYATLGVIPGDDSIDVLMINRTTVSTSLARGQTNFSLMAHELGHIIGLKHPFEGLFRLTSNGIEQSDYTTMASASGKSDDGLMIFDIETARAIYGTKAVATGDDVYRFDQGRRYYPGLVDDGGTDTIDVSAHGFNAILDLRPGTLSSVNIDDGGDPDFKFLNLGITNGTIIENAIGTAFADRITGNQAANHIDAGAGDDLVQGEAGDDVLIGGAGIDTAQYSVARSAATITRNDDGSVTINAGVDGIDTLFGIEQFRFTDGTFTFSRFDGGIRILLPNFTVAAGWSSQDQFPRHMADVNGDGLADIVGFWRTGVLVVLGRGNGSFDFGQVFTAIADFGINQGWTSDNVFYRELADVNGDGRDDVVGFGTAGVLVALARPNGTIETPSLGSTNFNPANGWTSQDAFARTLADVNGDGFAAIIGFGVPGTFVALGTGTGTFGAATFALANFGANQGWTSNNQFHREVGDVNGDGRADIVGFGTFGTLVALGQADGTFAAPIFALNNFGINQGWSSQDVFTRDLGDVNGDGRADVVGFGVAGSFVANGRSDGTFSSAAFDLANFGRNQGWTSDNSFHRELADVNGDGRADIVGFGQNGVFAAIVFDGQVI